MLGKILSRSLPRESTEVINSYRQSGMHGLLNILIHASQFFWSDNDSLVEIDSFLRRR